MRRFTVVAAALASLACASVANATVTWDIVLTNGNENPDATPSSPTSGTGTLVLNDAMTALSLSLTIFGIDANGLQTPNDPGDNLTAAHIHAGPAVTDATNGPVVWGFLGSPFNNVAPNEGVFTPFVNGVGFTYTGVWNASEGNGTTLTQQVDNILSGRAYVNVHTVRYAGGEVRGNIAAAVPEPGTWAMTLAGFALLGPALRRRRRPSLRAISRAAAVTS